MGTIKQGVLGGFSGKVGTVIGSSWKGIQYMRGIAQHVNNPKTPGQLDQRSKFAITIAFLKPITNFVRTGYKTYGNKQSPFNGAMSYIIQNAILGAYPNYSLDFSLALVSRGNLKTVEGGGVVAGGGKIAFAWTDNSGNSDAQATDLAMPLVFNKDKGEAVFNTAAATRDAEMAELNLPADWIGDKVETYLGFIAADGKNVANSVYLGEETVA